MKSPNHGKTVSPRAIFCHQTKLSVLGLGCIFLSCVPKELHENPQTTLAAAKTKTIGKQMASPHGWRQHFDNSSNTEMLSWCLRRAFFPTFHRLLFGKVLSTPSKEKHKHQASYKPLIYNGVLPARYARARVTQSLWEWSTNDWFDLRHTPWDGIHTRHCLDNQEPETR